MEVTSVTEWGLLYEALKTGGTLLIMGGIVWAFYQGKVMPRPTVDQMLEQSRLHTELLAKEISQSMEQAVTRGIREGLVEGVLEVRRNGGDGPEER